MMEWIGWILLGVYTLFSYWLFWYAAKHDAKLRGTSPWDEMPPIVIVAPIVAPILLGYIFAASRHEE
mgnify:CR=1 FL=1